MGNPAAPVPKVALRARDFPLPVRNFHTPRSHLHTAVEHRAGLANAGSGDTAIGRRVYPRVPDMRAAETQGLTDGELFYAIEQGIPWTEMPVWTTGTGDGQRESWQLVRFIRHLPAITADELKDMELLNPVPPPNGQREREIEDFLAGGKRAGVDEAVRSRRDPRQLPHSVHLFVRHEVRVDRRQATRRTRRRRAPGPAER